MNTGSGHIINNHFTPSEQTLAEAAEEIQQLLQQL